MRLLLVEDSVRLRESLAEGLRREGYAVDVACDGEEGLWFATHHPYDVIVLDIMLPKLDGLSLLRRLRDGHDEHARAHVLLLTARDTVEDRVTGLRSGADDYLVKPFAFEELLARIEALVRRSNHAKNPLLRIDDLEIDTIARKATRNGREIELAAREYALLQFLALRRGQVVSRPEIESHLYDEQSERMSNVIDAAVYSLRKKIDVPGRVSLIRTRRGMGYVMQASSERTAQDDAPESELRESDRGGTEPGDLRARELEAGDLEMGA
jgi:DNA-binding response OmpR family regulator